METNSYAMKWRCESMAYSGSPRLTEETSVERGKEADSDNLVINKADYSLVIKEPLKNVMQVRFLRKK